MDRNERLAELQHQLEESMNRVHSLEKALEIFWADKPCEGLEHVVTKGLQVATGTMPENIRPILVRLGYNLPMSLGGYQLAICLACGQHVVRDYFGKELGAVSEDEAVLLLRAHN